MSKRQSKGLSNPATSSAILSASQKRVDSLVQDKGRRINWQAIADSAPLLFFRVRTKPTFHFTYLNEAWHKLTGYSIDELFAEPQFLLSRIPADDLEKLRTIQMGKKSGSEIIFRLVNKQNKLIWLQIYISHISSPGSGSSYDGVGWDITNDYYERHENKTILELSARLRKKTYHYEMPSAILEQVNQDLNPLSVLIALAYPEKKEIYIASANGNFAPLVGYIGECSSSKLASFLCQFSKPILNLHNKRRINNWGFPPTSGYITLFPLITPSTKIGAICIESRQPIRDIDLRVLKAIARVSTNAINRTLTYEKTSRRLMRLEILHKLDLALSASLEQNLTLQSVIDQIHAAGVDAFRIFQIDPQSNRLFLLAQDPIISENNSVLPVQSFANQVLISRNTLVVTHLSAEDLENLALPSDSPYKCYLGIPLTFHHQNTGVLEIFFAHHFLPDLEDQSFFETLANRIGVALENSHLYAELRQKINALHSAQEQLIQQEKMAALGELVAGVAHELNNPITTIIGYAQIMQQEATEQGIISDFDEIILQANHASNIIHGLLDFSRQNQPNRQPVQVNDLIEQSIKLAALDLRAKNIKIKKHLSTSLPLIEADAQQLLQVFLNIIRNARDAMENTRDAELTIFTDWLYQSKNSLKEEHKACIQVIFKDNGPGIPESIIHRLFDPFFTTKKKEKGTGLGLAISYGIVTAHQGSITVENNLESGASFTIVLPVQNISSNETIEGEELKIRHEVKHSKTRILLIEDEAPLAKILSRVLENNGYLVSIAHSGRAALDLLEKQAFDMILCDYFLSDINGIELFYKIKNQHPNSLHHFCLMTGDIFNPTLQQFITENHLATLLKPFDIPQFISFIKSICSSEQSSGSMA